MIFVLTKIKTIGTKATILCEDTVFALVEVLVDPFSTNFDLARTGLEKFGKLYADGRIEGILLNGAFDLGRKILIDVVALGEESEPETRRLGLGVVEGKIEHPKF